VGGTCGTNAVEEEREMLQAGKPEGKKQQGRPRCRWMDNIKMELRIRTLPLPQSARWHVLLPWFRNVAVCNQLL
jgi:hypothetical protein